MQLVSSEEETRPPKILWREAIHRASVTIDSDNRRGGLGRGTVDHIFIEQQMPGFQHFRVTLGILDTSGRYPTKTNHSGRNDSKLSFDHILNGPKTSGVMLTDGKTPIGEQR